jgi:hypothetical protein
LDFLTAVALQMKIAFEYKRQGLDQSDAVPREILVGELFRAVVLQIHLVPRIWVVDVVFQIMFVKVSVVGAPVSGVRAETDTL